MYRGSRSTWGSLISLRAACRSDHNSLPLHICVMLQSVLTFNLLTPSITKQSFSSLPAMNLILLFLCPSQVKRTPWPQLPRAVGNVRLHGNQCLLHGTKDADLYPSSAQILDAAEEGKKKKMMWVVSTKNPFHPYFSQRQVGPIISMHDRATCPPLYPLSLCQTRQGLLALHRLTADLRCKSKRTKLEVYSNISIKRQHNRCSKSSPALSLFLPPGPSECQRYTFAKCFIALLFLSKRKGGGRSIIAPTGNEEFGRALFLPHE